MEFPPPRHPTLRDLPLPAKLVLTIFLIAIGLGYISAMMQLHFRSGSRDGNVLPTIKDVVKRYSGQDWPLNGKAAAPADAPPPDKKDDGGNEPKKDQPTLKDGQIAAIKIQSLFKVRCVECHNPMGEKDDLPFDSFEKIAEQMKPHKEEPKGNLHRVLHGPADSWGDKSMVQAFTLKSEQDGTAWKKLPEAKQKELEPQRKTELEAMREWVKAGAKKEHFDADAFPLPPNLAKDPLTDEFKTVIDRAAQGKQPPKKEIVKAKDPPAPKEEKKDEPVANQQGADDPVKVKIQSIISVRCAACHREEKKDVPLINFRDVTRLLTDEKGTLNPMKGKMHKVLTGPPNRFAKDSMVLAFTRKSDRWNEVIKSRPEAEVRVERENERLALLAWLEAGAPKAAYDTNEFIVPPGKLKGSISKEMLVGAPDPVKPIVSLRQIDFDSLVQSTHAHLLTFALLWTFTGLIFAFTSYPLWIRIGIAPVVLLAQLVDVLCWWLARLPDVGPYFAIAIMGTGAIVGMGLILQILLSMFNMYGSKGKLILAFLGLFAIAGLGTFYIKYIEPDLNAEKQEAAAPK